MRASAGRSIFFDRLAEGLQTAFYDGLPQRLALQAGPPPEGIPVSDLKSLARSICRLHLPAIEHVHEIYFSNRILTEYTPAIILNAEGHTITECFERTFSTICPEIVVVINFKPDGVDFPRLVYDPRAQVDLVADALGSLFLQCGRDVTTLAGVRFEELGFRALEDFGLFDEPAPIDWRDQKTLDLFYYRISRNWSYRGHVLTVDKIRRWVSQFAREGFEEEPHLLLMYLQQYGFVTETGLIEGLVEQYSLLCRILGRLPVAVSIQKPGKSEQKLAYRLKPQVIVKSLRDALVPLNDKKTAAPIDLVCFDDCIGSGDSIGSYLFDPLYNPDRDQLITALREGRATVFVIAFHVDASAVARLTTLADAHNRLKVRAVRIVDDTHRAFSPTSRIFREPEQRDRFMSFCREVGNRLFPGSPLGWNDCQWVICYDYSIPDNSLPVLFGRSASTPHWEPLFERAR